MGGQVFTIVMGVGVPNVGPPPLTIAFELVGDFGFCHKGEEREREREPPFMQ